MKRLLVAAMLVAMGAGAAEARDTGLQAGASGYQCSHFVPPGSVAPSDDSYGKHLAAQYTTVNGE